MMNDIGRRGFIRLAGGGVVLAALPACGVSADGPRAAWTYPGAREADIRKRALSFAILAPNPHNMQPWLADLSEPDLITLYVDTGRVLPVTDPFNRQIVLGCGAFLELLRMAAAAEGVSATVEPFPAGEPQPRLDERPVARVRFEPGGKPDPLFNQALNRRTNRQPFSDRIVPIWKAEKIVRAATAPLVSAGAALDEKRVERLKVLVFEGARIEANTPPAPGQAPTCWVGRGP